MRKLKLNTMVTVLVTFSNHNLETIQFNCKNKATEKVVNHGMIHTYRKGESIIELRGHQEVSGDGVGV